MSNVSPLDSTWKRKKDLAKEIGVHPRTINNMFNRGEVNKRVIDGIVWFQLACNARHENEPFTPQELDSKPKSETFTHESNLHVAMQLHGLLAEERARTTALDDHNRQLVRALLETKDELAQVQRELVLVKVERDGYARQANRQFNVLTWLKRFVAKFWG